MLQVGAAERWIGASFKGAAAAGRLRTPTKRTRIEGGRSIKLPGTLSLQRRRAKLEKQEWIRRRRRGGEEKKRK